jgi:spore germination protein (amino acid permease)
LGILVGAEILIAVILSFFGLEAIARVAKLVGIFALFSLLLLLALSSNYFRLAYLFPILGHGIDKTITTGILRSTAYAEIVILAVFAGSLQGAGHIKKAGIASLAISGLILSLVLLISVLVFSYSSADEITSPMYVLARIIKYGGFFQRLDPLFLLLFVTVSIISVSVLLFTTVSITCKMFRLQDARPVVLPVGILVFTLAMAPKDLPTLVEVYVPLLRTYGNITFFILPLLAFIVAVLRNKKGDGRHA